MGHIPISFGGNARVRHTATAQAAGVAGFTGRDYGKTTPSVSNVDVIGGIADDHAINVDFEERHESLWFTLGLLDLLILPPTPQSPSKGLIRSGPERNREIGKSLLMANCINPSGIGYLAACSRGKVRPS